MDHTASIEKLLTQPESIKSGSKEEMLCHLVTSYENNFFGWKSDDQGHYKDLFLKRSHASFLKRFYRLKKLKNQSADLYRVRPLKIKPK